MNYFDLHCHPTFKYSLLSAQARQDRTIDQPLDIRFKGLAKPFQHVVMWAFGDPIGSQSCMAQLGAGQAKIISHTIMALENAYTKSQVIRLLQCVSDALDGDKIDKIKTNHEDFGYWTMCQDQINTLRQISNGTTPIGNGVPRLRIINDMADYNPTAANTVFVLLNFEGGHCFYKRQSNQDAGLEEEILGNLIELKRAGIRPLYITLVHHAQNALANHAFAVPSQWAGEGRNDDGIGGFNPEGAEITPLGLAFIDEALSTRNGPPIYIDVKHMSLGSRMAYYDLRRQKHPTIPIIASHMGVTGVSWHDTQFDGQPIIRWVRRQPNFVEVKYNTLISFPKSRPAPGPDNPIHTPTSVVTFNPWAINLFNEDIVEILTSDGLIGLSLDVRILGMGNDPKVAYEHEPERFSLSEQTFSVQKHIATGHNDFDHLPDPSIQASLSHVEYLCNNLLHIVRIGRTIPSVGESVWNHICIGSDLDGLVVSIEHRNNRRVKADSMPNLFDRMKTVLPQVAQKMEIQLVPAGQPTAPFVEQVLTKLFLDNAVRFLNRYFRNDAPVAPHA